MTLFFGPYADVGLEPGYFYLCPRCYSQLIEPHQEQISERLHHIRPPGHFPFDDHDHTHQS